MPEETMLADLGVGPNGTIQLEMQSSDPVNNPIRSYRPRQEYQMPDVITVRVITGMHVYNVCLNPLLFLLNQWYNVDQLDVYLKSSCLCKHCMMILHVYNLCLMSLLCLNNHRHEGDVRLMSLL